MNTLTIKLKQHTPLIHFQYDQEGATLRASEVKPKLDKYILGKLTPEEIAQGKRDGWIKSKNDKVWLDYKMRIVCPNGNNLENRDFEQKEKTPMYFGNMNSETPKGISFYSTDLDLNITATENIHKIIAKNINEFFFLHNFGTRQSKGYGSFFLAPEQLPDVRGLYSFKMPDIRGVYSFDFSKKGVPFNASKAFFSLFLQIDYFYKTIRSGINQKEGYFKSLMYHYAKSGEKREYWDKRAIRTHFQLFSNSKERTELTGDNLNRKRELDKGERTDFQVDSEIGINTPPDSNARLYRDMLGLSSSQSWMFYGATISKEDNATNKEIDRFKSPILFKPLFDEIKMKYVVYIIPMPICEEIKDKEFKISVNYKEDRRASRNITPMTIKTPSVFDVADYLKFVFEGEGRRIAERQINAMPNKIKRKNKQTNKIEEIDNMMKKSLKSIYKIK